MSAFWESVGDEAVFERDVTEAAVAAFADVSGDHSPSHTAEGVMGGSVYIERIAHGALIVAYMSACSTELVERIPNVRSEGTPAVGAAARRSRSSIKAARASPSPNTY
ncbi:MAG TPA: MaoC/PaaZ C-terminal domain-containing protein [Roseiarcus sp.]|nr:MaoC/PaaZ C-terminal domain-containing protein [Roseiarcus sp.]